MHMLGEIVRKSRQTELPKSFVERFHELFPPAEAAYERINRRVEKGLVDEIAAFLHSQTQIKKTSAAEVLAHMQEGNRLNVEFVEELKRRCQIDALYNHITALIRSLS